MYIYLPKYDFDRYVRYPGKTNIYYTLKSQHLDEREILDYLMTSDFNEGLTSDESRFLLLKFRSFYRLLHAKHESRMWEIEDCRAKSVEMDQKVRSISAEADQIRVMYLAEVERPLTWRERLTGKKSKKGDGS